MTDPKTRRRIIHKRKKGCIPLSKLRMSDAVKIISNSPRRLEELFGMLEDRDRCIRDRAAATLAQLASLHPSRLLRLVPRLREALLDESAYVRWHLAYTLGMLCARNPSRLQFVLPDLLGCLDDPNRVVRMLASKALAQVAVRSPRSVEELFRGIERDIPPFVVDILRNSRMDVPKAEKNIG